MKNWLDAQWQRVPPKYKQYVIYVLGGLGALGMAFMFVSHTPPKKPAPVSKTARNIFGQKDMQSRLAITSVSSKLDQMEKENKELRDQLDQLKTERKTPASPDTSQIRLEIEKQVQQELARQLKPKDHEKQAPESRQGTQPEANKKASSGALPWEKKASGSPRKDMDFGKNLGETASKARAIKVITQSSGENAGIKGKPAVKKEDLETGTFLPAGSIFSGTLLTGLDVSCSGHTKKDPFPVLLRVKKEAILPNRYRADVQECFLIAAGWGDLGSERAYLRAERLACIREDGQALESKIDMFAVGEDGKAGLRGRLVSKTGALLSKALLAGFMEGFSQLFSKQPVLTISTGRIEQNSQTPFQSNLSKDALQSAGLMGMGSALERLSHYYIDMAKDIFPVIEIDAGRAVDFVLISGLSLKLQGRKPAQTGPQG